MKVLLVCLRVPYPPADGGTIAMYNMALALNNAGAEVKILALNTKKHFVDPANLPPDFVEMFKPEMVYLDATVRLFPALINLFSSDSYNISRFEIKLFHQKIKQILEKEEFDVIQLESLFVAPYLETIRKYSKAKVVLRAHNVEFLIWERLTGSEKNRLKKWYLGLLARRMKNYELSVLNLFDAIVALTGEDKSLLEKSGCKIPLLVSPIGLDTSKYPPNNSIPDHPVLFHLASMDWLPNIEAADWFLEKVYPLLGEKISEFKVYFAGKNMPERFLKKSVGNLVITGRVDDSKLFMHDKQIMLVPLLSGGGMRVKIIEGMAMGKVIISTTIGAEGIQYTNGVNILVADTPEEFCNAIIKCLSDPLLCFELGKNARVLAESIYDNKVIGNKILEFYSTLNSNSTKDISYKLPVSQ